MEPNRRRRRWRSPSLRGLMLMVLVVGGLMGWQARRASLQRRAVAAIERIGGSVMYDWEYRGNDFVKNPRAIPPGPGWLRRMLGEEYFQDVAQVSLPKAIPTSADIDENFKSFNRRYVIPFEEDQLGCLDGLDRLQSLQILWGKLNSTGIARIGRLASLKSMAVSGISFNPDQAAQLGRLTNLEELSIRLSSGAGRDLEFIGHLPRLQNLHLIFTPVDDAGMAIISRANRLESLTLYAPELTDAGLAPLASLKSLKSLQLPDAVHLTDKGLVHLQGSSRLVSLNLGRSTFTDAGLALIEKLPALEILELSRGKISDPELERFKTAHFRMIIVIH